MHSRLFNVAVFLLWLATMGWLMVAKVLPAMFVGEPPSASTILTSRQDDPTVGWKMLWNNRTVGWAVSTTTSLEHGMTQIDSSIHLDNLPLEEILPSWVKSALPLTPEDSQIPIDANSELVFDSMGHLSRFVSKLRFQPGVDVVKVYGTVDGPQMTLTVHSGAINYDNTMPTPQAMLSDAMSPQTDLPGLRAGQHWTVGVFSPLRPTSEPLETLHATVEGRQPMIWEGRTVQAWLVIYRGDPASGAGEEIRGKMWVHPNGAVLRQEARFLNATVSFHRMPRHEAAALAERVQKQKLLNSMAPIVRP
jgi:hypothetical protein